METTRRKLISLSEMLEQYRGLKGVKFAHFNARNRKRLEPEVEIFREVRKKVETPSKEFLSYNEERAKLAEHFADKDDEGNAIIKDMHYVINEKREEFDTELTKLKEQHKDIIEERDQQIKEYEEMLDEKIEFDGFKISVENIPNDVDSNFIEVLMDMKLLNEED